MIKFGLCKTFLVLNLLTLISFVGVFSQNNTNSDLFEISSNGKVGLANKSGRVVIKPAYESIGNFNTQCNCVLAMNEKKLWGILDTKQNWIVSPKFKIVGTINHGYLPVKENGESKFKFIDVYGKVLVDGFDFAKSFQNGLAAVNKDDKWGYINTKGLLQIPLKYTYKNQIKRGSLFYPTAGDFSQGLAAVDYKEHQVYIKQDDTIAIELEKGMFGGDFSEGLAVIWSEQKYGLINLSGEIILPPTYKSIEQFSEGLAAFRVGTSWGYLDTKGNIVINPTFDSVGEFSGGLATAKIDDKWGFIDRTGKFIIFPKYDNASSFQHGLAEIELNEIESYINSKGETVFKSFRK